MQHLRVILILVLSLFCTLVIACSSPEGGLDPAPTAAIEESTESININTATAEELGRIPHIGESLAAAVIEHRKSYGAFRRPEDLMLVDGISDARFRRIRHLIRTE